MEKLIELRNLYLGKFLKWTVLLIAGIWLIAR